MADTEELFSLHDVEAFTKRVYQGAFKNGSFDKARVNQYARAFGKAVEKGFKTAGGNLKPDFDTPDAKMLAALRNNVFHFSAAKNRAEIEAMSAALRDDKGRLRSFKDFAAEAGKITDEFQGRYMKTEYDLAVNASTMAARWADYEDDTVLTYETAHDNRVRPEHAALDGIAKPKNDPFWDTYYPPNGWNCRCTVMPTTSGRITPDDQLPPEAIDGVPPLFRSNFAKEGLAFPKDHPYYRTSPSGKEIQKAKIAAQRQWATDNLMGKFAEHLELGNIGFTNQGVKEFLNQPHRFFEIKNDALYNIEKIINEAAQVRTVPDGKGRPFIWHYLEFELNGQPSYLVIKEYKDGKKILYSCVDHIK